MSPEMEKLVEAALSAVWKAFWGGTNSDVAAALRTLALAVDRAATERACGFVCIHCFKGLPVALADKYRHRMPGEYGYNLECLAGAIRAAAPKEGE